MEKMSKQLKSNFYFIARKIIDRAIENIKPVTRSSTIFAKEYMEKKGWNNIIAVEVGTARGHNALSLCIELPIKKLYVIDPYMEYIDNNEKHCMGDDDLERAKQLLKKYLGKITFIRKMSLEGIMDIKEQVHFIYLDGNHDYENVKKELPLYLNKLVGGGILAGHDFDTISMGVIFAVTEFTKEQRLELNVKENDWWLIKS